MPNLTGGGQIRQTALPNLTGGGQIRWGCQIRHEVNLPEKVGRVMKKEFLDNVLGPKCGKSGLFSKARVSVRVRVRVSY